MGRVGSRGEPPACAPLRLSVKHGEVNINFIMGEKKVLALLEIIDSWRIYLSGYYGFH